MQVIEAKESSAASLPVYPQHAASFFTVEGETPSLDGFPGGGRDDDHLQRPAGAGRQDWFQPPLE